ncbi:MAG: flagellar basal body L-ring protein FlgH [Sphingomonas sp.]|jgi:flagellar L-ring protein precursor FlgH|nr:flagellar basal body L-ring protein FlgH [Sphingomonas sp.]
MSRLALFLGCLLSSGAWAQQDAELMAPPVVNQQPEQVKEVPRLVAPTSPPPRARAKGSLYSDAQFQSLTSDRRRFEIGEVLTIMVYENASATSSADTGTNRDSSVGMGISLPNWNKSAAATANNDFNGTGRTQRAGRVLAQITVLVREVMPNGDLLVGGEQLLEINGEKQTIRAEGRVRPRDISENNVVLSSRLAEAKLAFVGDGVLGDMQRPRWWQKLLSLFGI